MLMAFTKEQCSKYGFYTQHDQKIWYVGCYIVVRCSFWFESGRDAALNWNSAFKHIYPFRESMSIMNGCSCCSNVGLPIQHTIPPSTIISYWAHCFPSFPYRLLFPFFTPYCGTVTEMLFLLLCCFSQFKIDVYAWKETGNVGNNTIHERAFIIKTMYKDTIHTETSVNSVIKWKQNI